MNDSCISYVKNKKKKIVIKRERKHTEKRREKTLLENEKARKTERERGRENVLRPP